MDAAHQLSIARKLSQKSREMKDDGESLLNWEKSMKMDEIKRRAYNDQNDRQSDSRFEMHKAEGNKFYKAEKFSEAIVWYDKAMAEASSQAEISILYSNRAMCQLKMQQYDDVLKSCDKAIELDANNQKALYRRMLAYSYQNNHTDALLAGEQLLELNPRNAEALKLVEKIKQQIKKVPIKRTYVSTLDGLGEDVSFIDKPPHLQSRVPLRRIPVRIAAAVTTPIVEDGAADSTSDMDLESPTEESIVDLSFIEKADLSPESIDKPLLDSPKSSISFQKSNKELENTAIKSDQQLLIRPNTSAEFYREWKSKGTALARFPYLRLISAADLNKYIGSQLDSNVLTELLQVLAVEFIKNDIPPMEYLLELSKHKELAVLAMMMGKDDRQALESIIAYTNRRHDAALKQISNTFTI